MPTKHPRTNITHTPQVAHAIEVARREWPDEVRESVLLLRLLDEGARVIEARVSGAESSRRERIDVIAGRYSAVYPVRYLEELREDWDE
ncbi:hypothetical protein ACIQTT_11140 [Microbacterium sp. NPDC090225]|uniref:hypothetical protein n=1 Tax=Microbacterium sp. NPDC090225 TaxID=3364207 RepID=UPI00380D7BAE